MPKKISIYIFLICFFYLHPLFAIPISMEARQVELKDAIRLIAKYLNLNVILSSHIQGTTSFNWQGVASTQAFEVLLKAHGLAKWQLGHVWFISTQKELIQKQQEEIAWQTIQEASIPRLTYIHELKFARGEDIISLLNHGQRTYLSKRGEVYMDTRTNKIIIHDVAEKIAAIKPLIATLDRPLKQILIQVYLVSIDESLIDELGIDFKSLANLSLEARHGRMSITLGKLANKEALDIKLTALKTEGRAELIANPILFTSNHQLASIETGEEIPYQEVSEGGGTAISFKKAVLSLQVKPTIIPNKQILLQLQINQDKPSSHIINGTPSINTQRIMTNVLIKNGHTIALGGIYEVDRTKEIEAIAFIYRLPIIGKLFQYHINRHNKRKLLIFVTPSIV